MKDLYVVSCCRTAVGTFGGTLKNTPASELGAITVKEAMKRGNVKPEMVEEVMFGCVLTGGLGQNVARQVSLKAGIATDVPCFTVGMVCGSGMKALIEAARSIRTGDADLIVTGGTENMSAAPYAIPAARWGARMNNNKIVDTMVNDGLWDYFNQYHMGITAENVAEQYNLTREEMDAFALSSQQKTAAAQEAHKFDDEIVPVTVKMKKKEIVFDKDEHNRPGTTAEALAKLRPAFKPDGKVTAGNASGINDGAACVILASGEAVKKFGLKPKFKLVSWGQGGVDPSVMGLGPIPASREAMKKGNFTIDDMDLIEANEAFSAQSLAVARDLKFDMSKVNVNGGAISLGHPVGCSGARIIVTLLYEMMKRKDTKRGLATLCIGGGQGTATIFEKC